MAANGPLPYAGAVSFDPVTTSAATVVGTITVNTADYVPAIRVWAAAQMTPDAAATAAKLYVVIGSGAGGTPVGVIGEADFDAGAVSTINLSCGGTVLLDPDQQGLTLSLVCQGPDADGPTAGDGFFFADVFAGYANAD
jgi:hypothetical protein